MRARHFASIAALAVISVSTAVAADRCRLQQVGVMPVDMQGSRPLVWTKINGTKARFVIDSGAFYSTISRDAAAQYQLPLAPIRGGAFYVGGIGGAENAKRATAESFEFLGVPLHNVDFLVIDQNPWGETAGSIGQNLLRISDVEYDLANGIVRFIKPVGCEGQPLAYWAVSTPYSSVELQYIDVAQTELRATAILNGHPITVLFDTGSPRSLLSLGAAERAGITTSSPGVKFLGLIGGIGPMPAKTWTAPDATFQIGGEKVSHAHLLLADLPQRPTGYVYGWFPDMVLGEDFFLSHRIYVAYSQQKLYFTYNGGPLFNLDLPQAQSAAANPPAGAPSPSQTAATTGEPPSLETPTDADGFRRRGNAYASMREFDRALADLTRACDLAPQDVEAHYDRGEVYAEDSRFKLALQDYNIAITLQPEDIDARLARAELLQSHPDVDSGRAAAEAKSDLDAVSRLEPPAADMHRTLSQLYGRLGEYPAAIDQIDLWLSHHPGKSAQADGLNGRCWLRAGANRDLSEALADCNRALDLAPYGPETTSHIRMALGPDNPDILDSRALVYLRLGNLRRAMSDYDSALDVNPSMPTSLYGRGLAELRLGQKAQGENDLAAAEKLDSGISKRFASMGLAP